MKYRVTIPGSLPGLNQYINAERSNRYNGAKMKADSEQVVIWSVGKCMPGIRIEKPVYMEYAWYETSKRRDKDNIAAFGRKVIQDALVKSGALKNDGWKEITGFSDSFYVDKENPRIEITITEV